MSKKTDRSWIDLSRAAAIVSRTSRSIGKTAFGLFAVALLIASATVISFAQTANFEAPAYAPGNINGQNGWVMTGPYDMAVSPSLGKTGYGAQSLRISNAITGGGFGDMLFSPSNANEAGEAGATNGGFSGGTRSNYFEATFSITTTTTSHQPGLVISVSPDRGDGARMSFLRFADQADGIHVIFADVQQTVPCAPAGCANFVLTDIATLSRTTPHTIKFAMTFVNGPSNDLVKILIDGNLAHTGTSWEDYFRYDPEASADPNTHTVDSLIFRSSGTAVPANSGNGFLIDNLNASTGPGPLTTVVVNQSNINNWLWYNDGVPAVPGPASPEGPDPTCGSFVTGPGTTPLGVGSAQSSVSGQRRCNLATYQYAGTPLSAITELAYSTYNPSAGNPGSSSRSGYLQFNVDFNLSNLFQGRLLHLPSDNGTVTQNNWKEWDTINGGAALWRYSRSTWPAGIGGGGEPGTTPKTWNQILSQYPNVRIKLTDGFLGVRIGEPYTDGYTENIDAIKFGTGGGTTQFDFDPFTSVTVTPAASPTAFDNDYTRINNAVQAAPAGSTVILSGTFNWTETNAALSWSKGSDGLSGTTPTDNDNYTVLPPANRNGITITAASLGSATIQGPGDLAAVNLEGVFQYFNDGDNQNTTISNIRFVDFDLAIGMFNGAGGTDAYNGVKILNNYIQIAQDLNATVAPADVNQNIGIHYSFGTNQQISGNQIVFNGDGVSNGANFSTQVGMQSNTSGGAVYDGLVISNNVLTVTNAQSANPQVIIGIWENAHGHTSNISVTGNTFTNLAGGNNPATNQQRAFRVTSHSSATSTVTYANNSMSGANIGFQWIAGSSFTGNLPVRLTSNTIVNGGTGVLVQSDGVANLKFNRIVGNTTGVNNVLGIVDAENNWWGCNGGPGVAFAGCSGTPNGILGTVDANPWLVLTTSASPSVIGLGDSSTVTSFLNTNNVGGTPAGGFVPNGVAVAFVASLGTVAPSTAVTSGGAAGTTFFTANAFGTGGTTTQVDQQIVNAPITVTASCTNVNIPTTITSLTGQTVNVPLNVSDTSGRGLLSSDFTLTYNTAVLNTPVVSLGSVNPGSILTVNSTTPGVLIISIFNTTPFSGLGTLANVQFNVIGLPGTSSPVSFGAFKFNEGNPCSTTSNGLVTVVSGTITGTITYGNVIGAPAGPRFIPSVTLNAVGSVNTSATTAPPSGSNGQYTLSGMGSGAYTVTPSKVGGVVPFVSGGQTITSLDSARIAQHVVGLASPALTAAQLTVADVSGTGGVSSFDAALIARWVASLPGSGNTASWIFTPVNRTYANVNTNQTGQDYVALLMGDVTGNYDQTLSPARPAPADDESAVVALAPTLQTESGRTLSVPLAIGDTTDRGILSYQFELAFDPEVLEPMAEPVDVAGSLSENLFVTTNAKEPGRITVVVFGDRMMTGKGTLLNLRFNVIGAVGTSTTLEWSKFLFNEGDVSYRTTNGLVRVEAATKDDTISGRLVSSTGVPIKNARVTAVDTEGNGRTVTTSSLGYFEFAGLKRGGTYTVRVDSKRFRVDPQTISLASDRAELLLIAQD